MTCAARAWVCPLAMGVVAASASSSNAWAQGVSIVREASPASDRGFFVQDAEVTGKLALHAAAAVEYAEEPLVLVTSSQHRDRIVTQEISARAGLALAIRHRVLLAVELPVAVSRQSDAPPRGEGVLPRPGNGPELGDARGWVRVRVLGHADSDLRLSLAASWWVPSGARDSVSSDDRVRGGGSAILGGKGDRHDWSLEAGARTRRATELEGAVPLRIGTVALAGAAIRFALDGKERFDAGAELGAEATLSNGAKLFDPRSTRGLALGTLRWRPGGSPFVVSTAAGPGLGAAPGTGEWRGILRLGWSPLIEPPPTDHDHDGIPDLSDACPRLPGTESFDPSMHGCPEPPSDRDADSIPDVFDACPRRPGVPTGARATHGCPAPKPDRDQDGILDIHDACPDDAGPARSEPASNGCPAPPEPTPDTPIAELVADRIYISEKVQFDTGTAHLKPESDTVLTEVARVLAAHPDLLRLEVQGHTDDTGSPELNLGLSTERAEAVVAWLIEHQVDAQRLLPRGYGSERPLDDNSTPEGRERNRRVEFHVVDPEGAPP
ncbi:MAG: OmpA family protein [Polyangiaceae bacterium]|nr:OmpA family protein [Polyangiaceae bacterium]